MQDGVQSVHYIHLKHHLIEMDIQNNLNIVATPLWGKCEDETCTPKSGNLESSRTPEILELDFRGQNTLLWGALYIVGKILKCRCRKWPRMSHSDIYSTSYGRKKGRESNWQFDSQPLKVGNRPNPCVFRWSATHRWKALEESYQFALDLIPIKGLSRELWAPKVSEVQSGTISRFLLGSLGTKSHSDVGAAEQHREYYMGKVVVSPLVQAMVSPLNPCCQWLVPTPRVIPNVKMQDRVTKQVVLLPSLILELSACPSHPL